MRHVVLFLAGPTFAKTFDEKDGLEDPEIGPRGEAGVGEDLRAEYVVNTYLRYFVSCGLMHEVCWMLTAS